MSFLVGKYFIFSVIVNKCFWCFSNKKRSTEEPKPVETTERQKVEFAFEGLRMNCILVSYFFYVNTEKVACRKHMNMQ